jgi:hypothetical protein
MRVWHKTAHYQLIFLFLSLLFSSCRRSTEELPLIPPITHPLARDFIGFGVVNVSFTHFLSKGGSDGVSLGYIRRGTVVRIVERRKLSNKETWVYAEANYAATGSPSSGWLPETVLEIYDSESRAATASKTMYQ